MQEGKALRREGEERHKSYERNERRVTREKNTMAKG